MGNTLKKSISAVTNARPSKRLREEYDSDAEQDKIEEEMLNTPKRRKLSTTSEYIYEALYVNGQKSDVTICALGKEWKLHKVYLCQSGYFASMFNRDWKESEQNVIHIEIPDDNIDNEALNIAFGSLYRDDVMIKPTVVIQVLAAATLLSLDGLIQNCTSVMAETVSAKTVCDYHTASVMYGQVVLTHVCHAWLEMNIMLCQNPELLREIDPELMSEVIKSTNLLVMQVEMDVYSMLKKWLFLQFQPQWAGSMKDLICEAESFFRNKESTVEFLFTDHGRPYHGPFQALRLQHIVNDLPSTRIIEDDNILPMAWLMPVYRKQWLQMLRVEQGHDKGSSKPDKLESVFCTQALRCGRILQKEGQYCWRWTGYNFGVDLLVSFTSRLILIKRNTLSQSFPGSVGMQNKRHILYRMTVNSFDKLGHTTYTKSTDLKLLSLGKDQEQVILAVDRKAEFPLHVSCSFLVYTPKDELEVKVRGQASSNQNTEEQNAQLNDSTSSDESNSPNHNLQFIPHGDQDLLNADVFHLDLDNDVQIL